MLENFLSHRLTLTVVLVSAGLILRHLIIRRIRRSRDILTTQDRRHISRTHYTTLAMITITILVLWLPQIQHFILSITAIAVAMVIATKELSLCLLGALLIRTSRSFVIGDWIAAGQNFGDVIECNLLTTTIQEIENQGFTYTGRTVTIPNSVFLSTPVANQNFLRRYQFHSFSITIEPDAFPIDAESKLLARIEALTQPFSETAKRYNSMLEKRTGIDIPDAHPSVEFSTNSVAKLITTITVFCPTEEIQALEKAMIREFFDWYRVNRRPVTSGLDA